ncbi:DNA-binding CsgD family transcriptional regulator [Nocardioides sp. BE266]|uniref:helix-turn-helix transcriptional regulator n=1 Tax=Nocardioides sp. BE266 TaxID=2817725 RepID=UPI002857F67A|nr:LuxR C-terminal-related transcriptional regulator [Nocardioides sp. BE266]MDR7254665.1 DNA-binding CsgD family transcriptional regulator [Nocardioides sp. BE266]
MTGSTTRLPRGLVPLLVVSGVVLLVTWGLAQGVWLTNLHNGLLALAFTLVGAYVLHQRRDHPEGVLLLVAGAVQAVLFWGRQIGHAGDPASAGVQWAAWLGVWPIALGIALVTLAVIGFPTGRLPSSRWHPVVAVVVALALASAVLSLLWPVEYGAAGLAVPHPFAGPAPDAVAALWSALAHPAYLLFQVLWPVAIWARWRSATGWVRRQLAWLLLAAALAALVLVVGLLGWHSPTPGLLAATVVPVVAGLAVVHGEHAAAYSALTWMSRRGHADDLPADLARATGEALGAPATLWLGSAELLRPVGVWPGADDPAPLPTADLGARVSRRVDLDAGRVGALTVDRRDQLTPREDRLLDDLAAQAALVLQHLTFGEMVERERRAGHLDRLTPRERDVLELMAEGLSNAAICERLHLSVKTVEPVVGSVFAKLSLHQQPDTNRRVLAVLAHLRSAERPASP